MLLLAVLWGLSTQAFASSRSAGGPPALPCGPPALSGGREGRVDQRAEHRDVAVDIEVRLPGLLQDEALDHRQHETRQRVGVDAPIEDAVPLGGTEQRDGGMALGGAALDDRGNAFVAQRLGPDLNR